MIGYYRKHTRNLIYYMYMQRKNFLCGKGLKKEGSCIEKEIIQGTTTPGHYVFYWS